MELYQISYKLLNTENPTYISLGNDCTIAYHIEKLGYKTTTFPFDWIQTPNILLLSKLVHNNFTELFKYFTYVGTSYAPIIENNWNEEKQIMLNIKNTKYDITFKHDFTSMLYSNRKIHSEIQVYYNNRIIEFYKIMTDATKYKKLFRIGKIEEKNRLKFLNDVFINKGFKNYTIYFVPDNLTPHVVYDNNNIPIIDISQIDTIAENWKKSHYNWFEIFNSPLHNY
jgi:hypothetical protein